MLEAATKGDPAICGQNYNDEDFANDPRNGASWPASRTIRADVLEWLCTTDSALNEVSRQGIHVYAAKISGILKFAYTVIPFPLRFQRCLLTDDASFKSARIPSLILDGSWTRTILADGVDIANNVLLNAGFHSLGQVLFRDAKIGGTFRTEGSLFEYGPGTAFAPQSENALGCDRMNVTGNVILSKAEKPSYGSNFRGEVGFAGAFVGSNLECDGGTFHNPGKIAIRADRVAVGGSIFLRHGFSATGAVRLMNSTMHLLDCECGTFEGDGVIALNVEDATIRGRAVFDGSVTCSGGVQLRGVDVGDVSCRSGRFTSFDLRYSRVRRAFRWKGIVDSADTKLDLRDCAIGSIEDEEASWPKPGNFDADGLRYERFTNCPTNVKGRLGWIRLDKANPVQQYRQLAKVYAEMGETKHAREVLYQLEDLLQGRQRSSNWVGNLLWSLWRPFPKWTTGYGYKLWRTFWLMVSITIIGGMLADLGYRYKVIRPTDKDAYSTFVKQGRAPDNYPRFTSLMYTIEHSVPTVNVGVSSAWAANTVGQLPGLPRYACCLRWWFFLQTLAGWTLSIFFVAGLTGLVKSDK
jgi:hypothetical protein